MKKIFLFLIISSIFTLSSNAQGYNIEVKVKQFPNQDFILGHHKNDKLIPDDTVKSNSEGIAVFRGKKPFHEGMYFIFLPNKRYFDFIMGKDQDFFISNDTTDLMKNLKIKGSVENQIFADYYKFLYAQNTKAQKLRQEYKKASPKRKKEIEKELKNIGKAFEKKYEDISSKYPNMFFTKFLAATREIQVPDSIKDRYAQYLYYKKHYFDGFDISDSNLLYTPIYQQKIDTYLDKVVPPDPDSINAAVDMLLKKASSDPELYRYMLIHLYNKYAKSQLMIAENIFVHLADIYIKKATWSTDSFKNELKTKIIRKKNCLIGHKAKPLHMTILPSDSASIEQLRIPLQEMKQKGLVIEKDKSRTFEEKVPDLSALIAQYMAYFPSDMDLYDVKAPYTILWFMSPDCSHCKIETPKFFKDYKEKLKSKGVVVWCIYMERNTDNWAKFSNDIGKWFSFVEKNHFYDEHWYNMWNPFDNYRFKFDVSSTPTLYLLDKNKKILAKKIGYEQAMEIINDLEKNKKKNK
jgi:thiol-disulfide isomerase/thioredoxin